MLTWVKHEIYKRFYSYYIKVSDSVKIFWILWLKINSLNQSLFLEWLEINSFKQFKTYRLCCSLYTVRLMLNTSFFSEVSHLKNFITLLFMSSYIKKSFSSLKKCCDLAAKILSYSEIMCSYKKYVTCLIIYCVRSESFKCAECLLHTSQKCNLVISETEWVHVQRNYLCLCTKIQKTLTYLVHLQKQQNLIKTY